MMLAEEVTAKEKEQPVKMTGQSTKSSCKELRVGIKQTVFKSQVCSTVACGRMQVT